MKESLYAFFTDDPVNWLKWAAVFAVLILAYIPSIKLQIRANNAMSLERKLERCRAKGHALEARLVKSWVSTDEEENGRWEHWCHATYEYALDGKTKTYRALFRNAQDAPPRLTLYYDNDPRKLFSQSEYHYENHKALVLVPLMLAPWVLAALVLLLLKVPLPE